MKVIYYKNKSVTFDSSNRGYNTNEIMFFNGDSSILSINNIIVKLEYLNQIIIISDDIEDCFSIFTKQFVKLDAAGGLVTNPQGQILMIYRNQKWDLPKGKLEPNEKIEDCALREVIEECGVNNLTLDSLRIKTLHVYPLQGVWHIKTTWWYNMTSNSTSFTPQTEEGITKIEWVDNIQLQERLTNSYSTIISVINN